MAVVVETQGGCERKSDDCLNQTDFVSVSFVESAKNQCPVSSFQEDISMFRAAQFLRVCDSIGTVGPRLDTEPIPNRGNRIGAAMWVLSGAMAGLIALSAALYSLPVAPPSFALRVAPFVLFVVFFGILLARSERPRPLATLESQSEDPDLVRIGATAEGIHMRKGRNEATLPWDELVGFGETPTAFVLYTSSDLVHVLPKRVLSRRPATIYAVRSLLRTRVGERGAAARARSLDDLHRGEPA
jgi:hypothetical protein